MTATQLFANATKRNCNINIESEKFIGVKFPGQHVWHWFDVDQIDESVWFNHSYSQNTGTTKRGLRHGMKIKEALGFYKNI